MKWLAQGEAWFSQRNRREQWLITGAAFIGMWLLLMQFWLNPAQERQQQTAQQVSQQRAELSSLREEVSQLETQLQTDPNDALREQEAQLQARQQRLQGRLEQRAQLMPQHASVAWIETLLDVPSGVELKAFDTIEPQAMVASEGSQRNLWQHGVEVTVTGQYAHLRDYAEGLERLPYPLYWQALRYEVDTHPNATLTLRMYALSTYEELFGG
jgi:MSHA biogenesis protein MshJ